mmetsp:Transcript_17839/g.49841  ORF Transcript_17839/g.49841 Transcript_17839/m.49841 type:complete len:81 (-) Transcript_17839:336-578(-)|eukprot:scaffold16571_cov17-Tisochrysis_lutea.AAC.1
MEPPPPNCAQLHGTSLLRNQAGASTGMHPQLEEEFPAHLEPELLPAPACIPHTNRAAAPAPAGGAHLKHSRCTSQPDTLQ